MLVRFDSCILAGRCGFISLYVNSSGYKQKIFPGRDFRKITLFCFLHGIDSMNSFELIDVNFELIILPDEDMPRICLCISA